MVGQRLTQTVSDQPPRREQYPHTLRLSIEGSEGADTNYGLRADASTEGLNVGASGYSNSSSTNASNQYGLYGEATGEGTLSHIGVQGYGKGMGKYNRGLRGISDGAGNGDTGKGFGEGSINFGMEGNAKGNAWNNTGVEGSNSGDDGEWNFGVHGISNAGTGTLVENHGVAGRAFGTGINYGVYGEASGGATNWAGYFVGDVNVDGALTVTGFINGTTVGTSDRRFKNDIHVISDGLELTKNLRGVRYIWNDLAPGGRSGQKDIGLIAQEVEQVLPELVVETATGFKAVNYSQIVAVLIEAIKEMDDKINSLEQNK